ncbi:MAG: aminopeptidase [Anaerolineae bacterium]|nr:aminopeptidase [Anaerolineae bacterium]
MNANMDSILEKYANLIVRVGLNLQPGQRLLVKGPVNKMGTTIVTAPLVRAITKAAYQAEASLVDTMWHDDEIELIRFQHAPESSYQLYPDWRAQGFLDFSSNGQAAVTIYGSDPNLLDGQDSESVDKLYKLALEKTAEARSYGFVNAYNWLIVAYPTEAWAARVFPGDDPQASLPKLWDALIKILRLDQDDPVAAWEAHIKDLEARRTYLNEKQYAGLEYRAPGTDLKVGLPENHYWGAARFETQSGIPFIANLPTEEVFTIPHREKAEGVVSSSKPLSYGGSLVEDFSLTFEGGKVVNAQANSGEDILKGLLETDEGSSRLGEVALVPHSSPISQSGLLFYNTLFDENASNHIALGRAFKFGLVDGVDLSDDEFAAVGGNHSLTHVDFMVGSDKMDVDGVIHDGSAEPVMRAGEWAFDV